MHPAANAGLWSGPLGPVRHAKRSNLGVLGDDADHVPTAPAHLQDEVEANGASQLMRLHVRAIDEKRMANVLEDSLRSPAFKESATTDVSSASVRGHDAHGPSQVVWLVATEAWVMVTGLVLVPS